jgi:hypothetical protein
MRGQCSANTQGRKRGALLDRGPPVDTIANRKDGIRGLSAHFTAIQLVGGSTI